MVTPMEDLSDLIEMTSVWHRTHGLGPDYVLHVLQSWEPLPHDDRIKVRLKGKREFYSIDLQADKEKIAFRYSPSDEFLDQKEKTAILDHIKKHRHSYIKMTHDPDFSVDDLEQELLGT